MLNQKLAEAGNSNIFKLRMYYTYVMIIPTILLIVCFLARPSLLHFSLSNYFLYLLLHRAIKLNSNNYNYSNFSSVLLPAIVENVSKILLLKLYLHMLNNNLSCEYDDTTGQKLLMYTSLQTIIMYCYCQINLVAHKYCQHSTTIL